MDRKKYIVEASDDVKKVIALGVTHGGAIWTDTMDVENFEELNSDYINEHFGDLQDTAYQKGFEDGKAVHDKGCEGCMYQDNTIEYHPCGVCCNAYNNRWTAKDDRIEVGDELIVYGGSKCIATVADYENDIFYVMFADGSCGKKDGEILKKTGRHFDIAKILEEMRND